MSGAYDVSTFGYALNPATGQRDMATDQIARSPGARFFLPTWDEWLSAVHYDPSASGGAGGWWTQPNASNTPYGGEFPSTDLGYFGFRVAASIPPPSVALAVMLGGAMFFRRGRRS